MKKYLVGIILLLCSITINGQSLSVSSFRLLESDLTANTAGTIEKDQNGETAALIKVVTTQTGFTFDGGALGIVKTVQKPSEIWVYVPKGLKKITISHPQLGMLRDYYLTVPIEAARTYEMVLVTGEVQTVVKQARTSQYVVFQLTPSNAVVELNGELLNTEGGTAIKMMKFGTYDYRVQAPDHFPEAGKVTIDNTEEKHIVNINLKPKYSKVTLIVGNNAEIWVNGDKKGSSSWTGNLGAGTYEIETKKESHRSSIITKDIIVTKEPQTIQLPSPTPLYGDADISSNPAMADIFIDGIKVGQTPKIVSNILIGSHSIVIKKEGYSNYNGSLTINENETCKFTSSLKKGVSRDTSKFMHKKYSYGTYYGELVNDTPNGFGVMEYDGGEVYEGEWKNGMRSKGKHTYSNGDVYEGDYVDGVRDGYGTYKRANGDTYEGQWRQGYLDGPGKLTKNGITRDVVFNKRHIDSL